jgi:hypothetical protein
VTFAALASLPAAGEVIATAGRPVSFTKDREDWGAAFPAESEWSAVIKTDPSGTLERSRLTDHAPPEQVGDAVTVPEAAETETALPFSEQVPETTNAVTFPELIAEPADGFVIETVGATVSFTNVLEAWTAGFPAESERSAVTETDPSGTLERSRLTDQAPPEQVGDAVTAPEAAETETVLPFSEQAPETLNAETFPEWIAEPAAGEVIETVGAVVSFTKDREAWIAGVPAPFVRSAFTVKDPSETEARSRLTDQAPPEQVVEVVTAPETLTVAPFTEQVPETEKAAKFERFE